MPHVRQLIVAFVVCLVLSACAPQAATAPTPEPPTAQPAPTSAPTLAPPPSATPAPTAGRKTQLVDIADLTSYRYKSGIFSLDVPASWSVSDHSSDDEILVRFADKYNNGVALVDIFTFNVKQTDEQLSTILSNYLDRSYAAQHHYARQAGCTQAAKCRLAHWGYDVTLANGDTTELKGKSMIEQRQKLIAVITVAGPAEQFPQLGTVVDAMLNSFSLNPAIEI